MKSNDNVTRFIILGCGHTGSTLLSGIFKISGYSSLNPISRTFESWKLNRLNEFIYGIEDEPRIDKTIDNFLEELEDKTDGKWSLKDPLLPFTIEKIYSRINHPIKVLINYRNPRNTINHLVEDWKNVRPYFDQQEIKKLAEEQYYLKNKYSLNFVKKYDMPYILVSYEDLIKKDDHTFKCINSFVGDRMNYEFIKPSKNKSPKINVSDKIFNLYECMQRLEKEKNDSLNLNNKKFDFSLNKKLIDELQYKKYMFKDKICRMLPFELYRNQYGINLNHIRPLFPGYEKYTDDD